MFLARSALSALVALAMMASANPITFPLEKVAGTERLAIRADPEAFPTLPFEAAIGSPPQKLSFYVSTFSSDSYVNRNAYDPKASKLSKDLGKKWAPGAGQHGTTYSDVLTFGGHLIPNVPVGWPDEDADDVAFGLNGTLGFGPPKGAQLGENNLVGALSNGLLVNNVFVFSPSAVTVTDDTSGAAPPAPSRRAVAAGFTLTVGGIPQAAAKDAFDLESADTQFTVAGTVKDVKFQGAFDLQSEFITLPSADAEKLLKALGLDPQTSDSGTVTAEVPEKGIDVSFDFGDGKSIKINPAHTIIEKKESSTGYIASIVGSGLDGDSPTWILGKPFFNNANVIFKYEKNTPKVALSPVVVVPQSSS